MIPVSGGYATPKRDGLVPLFDLDEVPWLTEDSLRMNVSMTA